MNIVIPAVLVSSFFWSVGFFFLKKSEIKSQYTYLYSIVGQFLIFLILLSYLKLNENFSIINNLVKSKYGLLGGICFSLGTILFLYALKYGKNMPSIRVISMVFEIIFIIVLSCLLLNEKITFVNYLGILLTLIGVSMIIYFK